MTEPGERSIWVERLSILSDDFSPLPPTIASTAPRLSIITAADCASPLVLFGKFPFCR